MKLIKTFQVLLIIQMLLVTGLFAGSVGGTVYFNGPVGAKEVSGMEIYAVNIDSTIIASVYTTKSDVQGKYIFANLPKGNYEIKANTDRYVHDYLLVEVKAGRSMINLDIYLVKDKIRFKSSVEGTITDSETGQPLPLVNVSLSPNGMLPFLLNTITDELGKYIFNNIPNGTYNLLADKFGYNGYGHPNKIEIKDTTKIVGLSFVMTKLTTDASLSGIITNKKTGDAIEGAFVTISFLGNPILFSDSIKSPQSVFKDSINNNFYFKTKTDKHGKYEFSNLYSSGYWFSCFADDYDEISQEVKISGSTNLNFALNPRITGTISGNVFFDDTDNLVNNAWIEFIPVLKEKNSFWEYTTTDELGNYKANVPVGSYYIACSYNTDKRSSEYYYYREFYDNVQSITNAKIIIVTENETIENINFGIASPKEIDIILSGKVTDEKGNPIVDAMVFAYTDRGDYYFGKDSLALNFYTPNTSTNSEGIFNIKLKRTILSSIDLRLSADKEGYITEFYLDKPDWYSASPFKVNSDTTISEVNFVLSPYITTENKISGNITNSKGLPLANVFVFGQALKNLNNIQPSIFDSPWTITDAEGNYTLENLGNQKYIIAFFAKDYIQEFYNDAYTWEEATNVEANGVVSGIDAILDNYVVTLTDNNGKLTSKNISGIVKDNVGNNLSGVLVTLKDDNDKAIGSAQSGTNGSYSIASSVSFTSITATKFGYSSKTEEIGQNSSVQNFNLNQSVTDVEKNQGTSIPNNFSLKQNYPNPFNPTTQIGFSLPSTQNVKLEVYNVIGEKVATLINKTMNAGNHKYEFNASNLNSGLYFYRVSAGSFVEVKKMMLVK